MLQMDLVGGLPTVAARLPLTAEPAGVAALLPARLRIRAAEAATADSSALARVSGRLRAFFLGAHRGDSPVPVIVQIDDLQGRRHFSSEDAQPLLEVPLPAGTYHVTARRGELQRRYTVTLEPGVSFELHLRQARDGP